MCVSVLESNDSIVSSHSHLHNFGWKLLKPTQREANSLIWPPTISREINKKALSRIVLYWSCQCRRVMCYRQCCLRVLHNQSIHIEYLRAKAHRHTVGCVCAFTIFNHYNHNVNCEIESIRMCSYLLHTKFKIEQNNIFSRSGYSQSTTYAHHSHTHTHSLPNIHIVAFEMILHAFLLDISLEHVSYHLSFQYTRSTNKQRLSINSFVLQQKITPTHSPYVTYYV